VTSDQEGSNGSETPDSVDSPRFTDKRRIDPETGELRQPPGEYHAGSDDPLAHLDFEPEALTVVDEEPVADTALAAAEALAAERLEDLQRLQAEYVNYRKRVDRDRSVARTDTVVQIAEALIPVLDDIALARLHGELTDGPFASIAEKFEQMLTRFDVERYGEVGEAFDPKVHEALMHQHSSEVAGPTVVQVLQDGYRVGERIVRAARVAVAEPDA
jgi:molecular chaperone GrpE